MKKITKVLALFALSSTLLVGCKNKDQSGDDSSSESGEVVVTDWSDADKATMSSHLYGIVLPFLSKEGAQVEWHAETEEEPAHLTIKAGASSLKETEDYAKLFKNKDGWKGGDQSESASYTEYYFEKVAVVSGQKKPIGVSFYLADADGDPAASGSFYLVAWEPYLYQWPTAVAANLVLKQYGSVTAVPSIEADYYDYDSNGYGYSFWAYLDSETDDAGYGVILGEAGWHVKSGRDEIYMPGYYVATSPDQLYDIAYLYDEEEGCLDIHVQSAVLDAWPSVRISALTEDKFVIPAFELPEKSFTYEFNLRKDEEENDYAVIWVNGVVASDLDDYAGILGSNDWVVNLTSETRLRAYKHYDVLGNPRYVALDASYAVDSAGNPYMILSFGGDFSLYPTFPSCMSSFYDEGELELDMLISLPNVFEYDDYYFSYGFLLADVCTEERVTSTIESYVNELVNTYNFTVKTVGEGSSAVTYYISEHEEYALVLRKASEVFQSGGEGYIAIYPQHISSVPQDTWPAGAVSKILVGLSDSVPALAGASSYALTPYSTYYYVQATFDSAEAAAAALTTYEAALVNETNKYTKVVHEEGTENEWYEFVSEHEQISVQTMVQGSSVIVFIDPIYVAFPSKIVNRLSGSPENDVVLSLTGAEYYTLVDPQSWYYYGFAYYASAEAATTALEAFAASATANGYTYTSEYGGWYVGPNEEAAFSVSQVDETTIVFYFCEW